MPRITHMCVDLNDHFSCQEFHRLLCNCSVKGCRENTWDTSRTWRHARCDWRGQDRQSPHRHKLNSPHAPTYNVFHLFRCFYPPLRKKHWSWAERSSCLYHSSKCGWWCISFASRAASRSSQSSLTQNLTLWHFFAKIFSFLWMKNYHLNPVSTRMCNFITQTSCVSWVGGVLGVSIFVE